MKNYYKIVDSYVLKTVDTTVIDETWNEYEIIDGVHIPQELEDALTIMNNKIAESKTVEEYKAYLTNTDWYFARKLETGELVPQDVLTNRAEAREYIRSLENGK